MAEDIPISEVRRVLIEYEIRVPTGHFASASPAAASSQMSDVELQDLAEKIRRELLKVGARNPSVGLS